MNTQEFLKMAERAAERWVTTRARAISRFPARCDYYRESMQCDEKIIKRSLSLAVL